MDTLDKKNKDFNFVQVASIETLGALDGPGLRTILFLQGCPLRCKYCHNADMLPFKGGTKWAISDLIKKCEQYKSFYGTNGGVTISGGEPLAQGEATYNLIVALQKKGIHVALDTSGFPYSEKLIAAADLILLDVKHTEPEGYLQLTSVPIDSMLKTLDYIKKIKKPFWVRQVTIPTITDSDEQVLKLKELSQGAIKIELLAYHKMGIKKWKAQGIPYPLDGVPAATAEIMDRARAIINYNS